MADTALLHTPWDCKWSRFARRATAQQARGDLWECVHDGERQPIAEADCEACPFWEYQSPFEGLIAREKTCARAAELQVTRRLEHGVRLSLFVIGFIFAACGFVVLTQPLAVPFTVSLWLGAACSFILGVFGNFRSHADGTFRGFLPPRA